MSKPEADVNNQDETSSGISWRGMLVRAGGLVLAWTFLQAGHPWMALTIAIVSLTS